MIKFFRTIRQKLVQENRVGKYLLYAVGEIFLVIIGILIALSLNKASEAKIQEKKVEAILKQVQDELKTAIEDSELNIEFNRIKDSLIYVFMNNELTKNDLKDPRNHRLTVISSSYRSMDIQNDGFNSLMLKSEIMPDKYDNIASKLKKFYIGKKPRFDTRLSVLGDFTRDFISQKQANYDWFTDVTFNNIKTDEFLDYLLYDKHYINSLTRYDIMAMRNLVPQLYSIRIDAIKNIHEIDSLLETDNTYPFDMDINEYADWIGKYHFEDDTIQIDYDEKGLKWNIYGAWSSIYPLSNTKFHDPYTGFFNTEKDERGRVNGLKIKLPRTNVIFKKIK
jgi:hypothetical protein